MYLCVLMFTQSRFWGGDDGRPAEEEWGRGGIRWEQGSDGSPRPCRGLSRQRADGPLTLAQGESIKSSRQEEKNEGVKKYIIIILSDTLLVLTLTGWSVVRRRQQGLMGESGMSVGAGLHSAVGAALHLNCSR